MAEVADWSPVDESNNSAPPVGAPENMAPSAVNNVMRAMQGSIRRWYDTVTTQLAGYLPLAGGGTVTGNVAVTGYLVTGNVYMSDLLGALYVHNPVGGGGISIDGASAGYVFGDRGGSGVGPSWVWYANAGSAYLTRLDSGAVITATLGGVAITGNLTVSGGITIGGGFTVGSVHSLSDVTVDGSLYAAGINCSGDMGLAGALNGNVINANQIGIGGTLIVGGDSDLANVHIAGQIYAIGNDPQFHIKKVGEQRIINFEPNTYIMFDAVTNTMSIVIDGVTKASW